MLSKSALKNQGMSLRVERSPEVFPKGSETKQSQGMEGYLHSVTWFGLFVPTYLVDFGIIITLTTIVGVST